MDRVQRAIRFFSTNLSSSNPWPDFPTFVYEGNKTFDYDSQIKQKNTAKYEKGWEKEHGMYFHHIEELTDSD